MRLVLIPLAVLAIVLIMGAIGYHAAHAIQVAVP